MAPCAGWVGTVLALFGCYQVGERKRSGFIWQLCGNLCWTYVGYVRGHQWDLVVVSIAFATLYAWNYWKWSCSRSKLWEYDLFSSPRVKNKRLKIRIHETNGQWP